MDRIFFLHPSLVLHMLAISLPTFMWGYSSGRSKGNPVRIVRWALFFSFNTCFVTCLLYEARQGAARPVSAAL